MRVSVSHMGNIYVTIRAWAHGLGRSDILIVPPANSQRTLSLGTKYSPEGLCLPFKLTLGNRLKPASWGQIPWL